MNQTYMQEAYAAGLSSPDPSTQNGAILIHDDGRTIIGTGCNHFPVGVDETYWNDKPAKYARVVHAELAAILDAAKNGYSTRGSTLYCPWAACSNCAKYIAAAGVTQLVRHNYTYNGVTTDSHWYEDCKIGDETMTAAGVDIIEIPAISTTIKLRRDGKLWP